MKKNKFKIVIAPDSFKGSISSIEAARYIKDGIRKAGIGAEMALLPIADGGEGTVDVYLSSMNGKKIFYKVSGPLNEKLRAPVGYIEKEKLIILEMASAAGLPLVLPEKRNPLNTTTLGVGELIKKSFDHNPDTIIVGVGGSATVDGGIGMAQALGYEFINTDGKIIPHGAGGGALLSVKKIISEKVDKRIRQIKFKVASDVSNPLTGKYGAARIFAPQKGAEPEQVKRLEKSLTHFSKIITRDLPEVKNRLSGNKTLRTLSGGGAAGGLGMGLFAFCGAEICSGAKLILETLKFDKIIKGADLIITGEGAVDAQTFMGKGPGVVAEYGKKEGVPVIMICGSAAKCPDAKELSERGILGVYPISNEDVSIEEAKKRAPELIKKIIPEIVLVCSVD